MENVKQHLPSYLLVIFELVAGILLLIDPKFFTRLAVILIGVALLIIGIIYLVRYFKTKNDPYINSGSTLAIAITALIPGVICTFLSWWILGLFAVVAVFYGIIMIISGIFKIQQYSQNKRQGIPVSGLNLAGAIVSIVLGVIIVFNPFRAINLLWIFVGISLLVEGIFDLIVLIKNKKNGYY